MRQIPFDIGRVSLAWFLMTATVIASSSAYADDKRKVTRFDYDDFGRQVLVEVFDDTPVVDGNGDYTNLLTRSETEYDALHNVLVERQTRVIGDQDGDGVDEPNRYSYDVIEQRYAYEDTTWPTKVTKKYQPRFHGHEVAYREAYAEQYYYDQTTGSLDLYFSSSHYCVDTPWNTSSLVSGSFNVERSGSSSTIEIKDYVLCHATGYTYDGFGRTTEMKDSLALHYQVYASTAPQYLEYVWKETVLEYWPDADPARKGALKSAWQGAAGEALRLRTDFDWDAVGNLTKIIQVDNLSSGSSTSLGTGNTVTAQYDALRRVEHSFDAENGETRWVRDASGRLRDILKKLPNGNWATTHADYFDNGQIKEIHDPDGDIQSFTFDAAGRYDIVTDGAGRKTKTIYYPNGQAKCSIKGYGTDLAQAYAMYEYAADGNVIRQRPAKGVTLIGGNNPTDCLASTTDYDTVYTYDEYRRLFQTTFPKGNDTTTDTNPRTGLAYTDSNGHTYTRQWLNQSGQPYQNRTRFGDLHQPWYDVTGNPYNIITHEAYKYTVHTGSGLMYYADIRPKDEQGNYSDDGRRYSSFAFDALGRPAYEQYAAKEQGVINSALRPYTYQYYDTVGNANRMRYWSGAYTRYSHDKRGAMKTAWFSANGNSAYEKKVAHFYYDTMGRKTHHYMSNSGVTRPDGGPMYGIQYYYYDADSDLKKMVTAWSPPTINYVSGFHYNYDQDGSGKIINAHSTGSDFRYTPQHDASLNYTSANKLDQMTSVTGNLKMQIVAQEGTAPASETMSVVYDGNGSVVSDGAGRTYTYNSENQLIEAQGTAAGDVFHVSYLYDGIGRRSHSRDHITGTETLHMHFGQMEVEDYEVVRSDPNDAFLECTSLIAWTACPNMKELNVQSRVVLGAGIDQRLAWHDVAGDDLFFPATNHQGSTIAMFGEDGNILPHSVGGTMVYDPYGNIVNDAPVTGYPYRYTGRRLDAQTGCYYYRARYKCNGPTGEDRFLQTDPIGYADQMNLYNYVGNDPLNFVDPNGQSGITCEVCRYLEPKHKWVAFSKGMAQGSGQFMLENTPVIGGLNDTWIAVNDPSLQNVGIALVSIGPGPSPRRMNLGSGGNPMPGAINVDIRPVEGVDVVADANALPLPSGSIDEVHSVNPRGFNPVNPETARVLAPGGTITVTGTPRNPDILPPSSSELQDMGLELVETGPMKDVHNFGVQRQTDGGRLKTENSTTTIYRKIE